MRVKILKFRTASLGREVLVKVALLVFRLGNFFQSNPYCLFVFFKKCKTIAF